MASGMLQAVAVSGVAQPPMPIKNGGVKKQQL